MRIGEFVRRTGVSERLLRHYEEQGLLRPERGAGGQREYGEGHVEVVRRIRCLLSAGLGTTMIATVLPCLEAGSDHLAPTCPDMLVRLLAERDRIDRAMEAMRESREALDSVIAAGQARG